MNADRPFLCHYIEACAHIEDFWATLVSFTLSNGYVLCRNRVGRGKDIYWVFLLWRSIRSRSWKQWKAADDTRLMSCFTQQRSSLCSVHFFVSLKWQIVKLIWVWLMLFVNVCVCVCVCVMGRWQMSTLTNCLKGTWVMQISLLLHCTGL